MARYVLNPDGVTTPADLMEQLGAEIAARYGDAEARMIDRVARLAADGLEVGADVADRARILGMLRAEGEQIALSLADQRLVNEIISIAAADGQAAAVARLGLGRRLETISGVTGTAANAVGTIALDLGNRLEDMTQRITRWMPDAYQRVISTVSPGVILGVDTLAQAQRNAAQKFLAQGVTGFTDRGGANWRIGTYAEMATRTSVNRAWMESNILAQQSAGINLVSIIVGLNACEACAAHAGRIYSTDGTPAGVYEREHAITGTVVMVTVAGTLQQARDQGWNHPNCRCVVVAYMPGLSTPAGATTYNKQAEEDRDRLRALERRVRELKRREAATFDDIGKARIRSKIRTAQRNIRDHVGETGLLRRNYREQLSFSDGTRPALPPLPAPRPVLPPTPTPSITSTPPTVASPPAVPPARPFIPGGINDPNNPYAQRMARGRAEREAKEAAARAKELAEEISRKAKQAARAGLTDEIRAQRVAAARLAVKEAKTGTEVQKILKAHLADHGRSGVNVAGFGGARVSVEAARDIADELITLFDEFPDSIVNKIQIRQLSIGTRAQARGLWAKQPDGTERLTTAEIQINNLNTSIEQWRRAIAPTNANNWHHEHEHTLRYTVRHEWGHTLDYAGQRRIRTEARNITREYLRANGIVPDSAEYRAQISDYGATSVAEQIAEAFADVRTNGDRAKPLSRLVHDRLIEIYEQETRRP